MAHAIDGISLHGAVPIAIQRVQTRMKRSVAAGNIGALTSVAIPSEGNRGGGPDDGSRREVLAVSRTGSDGRSGAGKGGAGGNQGVVKENTRNHVGEGGRPAGLPLGGIRSGGRAALRSGNSQKRWSEGDSHTPQQ